MCTSGEVLSRKPITGTAAARAPRAATQLLDRSDTQMIAVDTVIAVNGFFDC